MDFTFVSLTLQIHTFRGTDSVCFNRKWISFGLARQEYVYIFRQKVWLDISFAWVPPRAETDTRVCFYLQTLSQGIERGQNQAEGKAKQRWVIKLSTLKGSLGNRWEPYKMCLTQNLPLRQKRRQCLLIGPHHSVLSGGAVYSRVRHRCEYRGASHTVPPLSPGRPWDVGGPGLSPSRRYLGEIVEVYAGLMRTPGGMRRRAKDFELG